MGEISYEEFDILPDECKTKGLMGEIRIATWKGQDRVVIKKVNGSVKPSFRYKHFVYEVSRSSSTNYSLNLILKLNINSSTGYITFVIRRAM